MIHRDISSANILLDPLPSDHWKAKVSDYGSVNLLECLQTVMPGNLAYAAPEANIPANQSPKMDIFSFGVLLIEMLTRRLPDVNTRKEALAMIRQPAFLTLVQQCLNEEREFRPSAQDLITDLGELASQ